MYTTSAAKEVNKEVLFSLFQVEAFEVKELNEKANRDKVDEHCSTKEDEVHSYERSAPTVAVFVTAENEGVLFH